MAYWKVEGYCKTSGGDPVSGLTVRLTAPNGTQVYTDTNYAGYYIFPSVEQKVNQYKLEVYRTGVLADPKTRLFIVDENKVKDFTISGQTTTPYSISGRVTGATGTSIKVSRTLAGSSYVAYAYTNPTTGDYKIWWTCADAEMYPPADVATVWATDPTGNYTLSPASQTYTVTADLTGVNFVASGSSTTGYDVYGYVYRAGTTTGVAGIAVGVIGQTYPEEITCITDSTGKYTAPNCRPDVYGIIPTRTGATFVPTSGSATVVNAAVHGTDFEIIFAESGQITGTLTHSDGTFGSHNSFHIWARNTSNSNVYLAEVLSPAVYPVTYTIDGLPDGTYVVAPDDLVETGSWSADVTVTVTGGVPSGAADFLWTKGATGTGSIAGTVTLNGSGFPAVTMELRSGSVVTGTLLLESDTATDGTYTFSNLANGTYTVVPVKSGYIFSPVSITIMTTGAASTGNNFFATLSGGGSGDTFSVSGLCYQGTSTGVPGVLVTVGTRSAVTDAYGNYIVSGVKPGSYTIRATKTGYTWTASGWSNPVTVGYANVTDIDWFGTGGTSGGGGGSDVAVPYEFTNAHDDYQEAVDADKLNANFDTLADAVNNITDGNISDAAGIDPSKIGSSLGNANLQADILSLDERVEQVFEVDPNFIKNAILPCDEDGIDISPSADGTVAVGAGKHLLMNGKRYELTATNLPNEGTLAAQSVYALRGRVATDDDHHDDESITAGDLFLYLVPLAGNALGSGDTGSTKYAVAEITGSTSGSKFTFSGHGSAPMIGAYCVCLDDSYEKFFIAYQNGSTIQLADALGATPTPNSRVGICIDDPSYKDDPGSLGGVSTPTDALLAIVWQGTAGSAPYVQKVIPRNYETLGRSRVISSAWSERATITDTSDTGYDEVQLALPATITAPVQIVSITAALYDVSSGDPTDATGLFYGPLSSIAFKTPDTNPKGLEMRVTPEKIVARFAKGQLRILSATAAGGTAVKSARFKVGLMV